MHFNKKKMKPRETTGQDSIFRKLLNSLPDIIFIKNNDGVYLDCSETFAKLTGQKQQDIVGKKDCELFDTREAEFYTEKDRAVLDQNNPVRNEEWITYPDGKKVLMDTLKAPLFDEDGSRIGILGVSRDITEQRQIQDRLKSSEENFRTFFSTIDDLIFIADRSGRIFYVNPSVTEKLGYSLEEIKMMHVLDFNPEEKRQEAEQIFSDMFAKKRSSCPLPLVKKDGTYLPAETRVWFGKWDNVDCIFGVSKDLTKEQENLQKFNKIFENNPALMAISEVPDRSFTEVNEAFISTLGYTREEIIGRTAQDLKLFEDDFKFEKIAKELIENKSISNKELRVRKKNGEFLNGLFSGELIESQGKDYFLTVMIDLTKQKMAEQSIEYEIQMQKSLMNLAASFINIPIEEIRNAINRSLEEVGHFVHADRVYIFDYDHEAQTTSNTYEWCEEGIAPQIENLQDIPFSVIPSWVEAHMRGLKKEIPDVSLMSSEDSTKEILEEQNIKSVIALPMMSGTVCIGFIGFDSVKDYKVFGEKEIALLELFCQMLVNVRIREKLQNNLTAAKIQAETANKAKSQFLANMSHEIRTPLNGLSGYLQLLEIVEEDPTKIGYIEGIKSSMNTLLKVINDILDVSKIEAGKLELESIPFDFRQVITDAIKPFHQTVAGKNIAIVTDISEEIPFFLIGDPLRLTQILTNLMSNAVKFTEHGRIEFSAQLMKSSDTDATVQFIIKDTGKGIDPDKVSSLFAPFEQEDLSSTRRYGGTGLGLSICKSLVTLMNGTIEAKSALNVGSTFTVTLPFVKSEPEDSKDGKAVGSWGEGLRGLKVLVAEDNEINRDLVREILLSEQMIVDCAANGKEAVEMALKNRYDVVLMDCQMPVMDGCEATREIRRFAGYHELPIIALTANAMSGYREKYLSYGMNDYVTKPIDLEELFRSILRCINKNR